MKYKRVKEVIRTIYYRISDKEKENNKMYLTTAEICIGNFMEYAKGYRGRIIIVLDNCNEKTKLLINNIVRNYELYYELRIVESNLGNSGSIINCMKNAIENNDNNAYNDCVYFVEDDYIHRNGAMQVLQEGLQIADYVTLYDHPDKYTSLYGNGEQTKVFITPSSHWKYTISTCMTFAAKINIIKEDFEIWLSKTKCSKPQDNQAFCELNRKGRTLIAPIPGFATHTEIPFLAPNVNWRDYIKDKEAENRDRSVYHRRYIM